MGATQTRGNISLIGTIMQWCRGLQATHPAHGKRNEAGIGATLETMTSNADYQHAKLIIRRMERLNLDAEALILAEPQLFQELQAACFLCPCPERCAVALLDEAADLAWQDWRDYCPNATRLSMMATLQHCCSERERERPAA